MAKPKYLSKAAAHARLAKYCAYRERAHSEVRYKLIELGIFGDDLEDIMSALIADNYLNEERYAKAYVGGKFRIKKWGRNKIRQGLKQKKVSAYSIKKGMEEIDDKAYWQTMKQLIEKKRKTLKDGLNDFEKNARLARFMAGKGYESNLVWEILKNAER